MVLGVKSHILAFRLIREKGKEERTSGAEKRQEQTEEGRMRKRNRKRKGGRGEKERGLRESEWEEKR